MRHINLERRGRHFYYRASFTLDGKVVSVRLALNTTNPALAHERAARLGRVLKGRWKQLVEGGTDRIDEQDKASILRATAIKVRDGLEALHADEQAAGYDDAHGATLEQLRTLRGFEYVARDIYANGVGPSFGTFDHFYERFVEGMPELEVAQLEKIRQILATGSLLPEASETGAIEALRHRNVHATPANVVIARRQMMLGVLIALREAEQQLQHPTEHLDTLLAKLEMPPVGSILKSGAAVTPPVVLPTSGSTPASVAGTISPTHGSVLRA